MLRSISGKIFDVGDSEGHSVLRELFTEADKLVLKKRNAGLKEFVEHLSLLERHNISPIIGTRENKEKLELMSIQWKKRRPS
jgi:hypothetical protein